MIQVGKGWDQLMIGECCMVSSKKSYDLVLADHGRASVVTALALALVTNGLAVGYAGRAPDVEKIYCTVS